MQKSWLPTALFMWVWVWLSETGTEKGFNPPPHTLLIWKFQGTLDSREPRESLSWAALPVEAGRRGDGEVWLTSLSLGALRPSWDHSFSSPLAGRGPGMDLGWSLVVGQSHFSHPSSFHHQFFLFVSELLLGSRAEQGGP